MIVIINGHGVWEWVGFNNILKCMRSLERVITRWTIKCIDVHIHIEYCPEHYKDAGVKIPTDSRYVVMRHCPGSA